MFCSSVSAMLTPAGGSSSEAVPLATATIVLPTIVVRSPAKSAASAVHGGQPAAPVRRGPPNCDGTGGEARHGLWEVTRRARQGPPATG
jgi:hypothetical protein